MISLSTCVEGQKLRLRNEDIIEYKGPNNCNSNIYNHAAYRNGKRFTYTDSGSYFWGDQSMRDVIEILPLETTTPASHPSIAWWDSCPWITGRKPTALDGDVYGRVYIKSGKNKVLTSNWSEVGAHENWIHLCGWQPPALTNRKQALQLLDDHQDGWRPTPEQWLVIRKGLDAS